MNKQVRQTEKLNIANRSHISCARNMSRTLTVTLWPWNLG